MVGANADVLKPARFQQVLPMNTNDPEYHCRLRHKYVPLYRAGAQLGLLEDLSS